MRNNEELDKLLEKWRQSRGPTIRKFLGERDVQRITLRGAFPRSAVTVTSPFELHKPWPDVVVEGPSFQLNILYEHLEKLVSGSKKSGGVHWNGILRQTDERIDLTYRKDGNDFPEHMAELLEYRFRCDAALFLNLRLSDVSVLEVVHEDKKLFHINIPLLDGFPNGTVELPMIEFLQ